MIRRRTAVVALTGLAALALAGCGESREECEQRVRSEWQQQYQRDPTQVELDDQCSNANRGGGSDEGK